MRTFSCSVAQEGFYVGPVWCFAVCEACEDGHAADAEAELRRFRAAADALKRRVEDGEASEGNRAILETVSWILSDKAFAGEVERGIREDALDAPAAVRAAAKLLEEKLGQVGSEYLRSRSEDVRGVANRLVAVLSGDSGAPTRPCAICGEEISPAELASIDERLVGGLLSEKGSLTSHVAILAGNLGVPYLYGSREAVEEAARSSYVILDSAAATATFDPDEDARAAAELRMAREAEARSARAAAGPADEDLPACRTRVCANIEGPKDIEALLASGADGAGLFRTEFLFMGRQDPPGEGEQYEAYRSVLDAMGEREVTIRTMDIGSDKSVGWLDLPREANPALGLRGARVSLEYGEVFSTQLRALLRAAVAGNLRVMFPMIASAWEIDEIIAEVRKAADGLAREGVPHKVPELGIMVETPAAAVCAGELARRVSFFSVGTNDLAQYTLAIDREGAGLQRYANPRHEAVFRLIEMAVRGGHSYGVRTAVCGRLAADPDSVRRLVELGVDELSVPVGNVRAVKRLVAEIEAEPGNGQGAAPARGEGKGPGRGARRGPKPGPRLGSRKKPAGGAPAGEGAPAGADGLESQVAAVADGELVPMGEIPDTVFSSGYLGECFGILPENGCVYAPVDGTVSVVARTEHSVTIAADDGRSILVHVGINTARLTEKAFTVHVRVGDRVAADQLIMEADLGVIERAGFSSIIVVAELS